MIGKARWLRYLPLLPFLAACTPLLAPQPPAPAIPPAPPLPAVAPASYQDLPGWAGDRHAAALSAFREGCRVLMRQPQWQGVCQRVPARPVDDATARAFFEQQFAAWRLRGPGGAETGLMTGYYEPLLTGSRTRSARYAYPVLATPDDMLTIDLKETYPDLGTRRLRGRLVGSRVLPYYSRAEIDGNPDRFARHALLWVDDPLALFFLHVQGSGRIRLESGETVKVGYANQNGHPYVTLAKVLLEHGEISRAEANMPGIYAWARQNPGKVPGFLNKNPSYVFFRILEGEGGPLGALGVPLTAGRSIAIDPAHLPLGAPVFVATEEPLARTPWQRLMVAQDTGGAIKGQVRADLFFGFGAQAGALAGMMKEPGQLWLLYPRGFTPPGAGLAP